MIITSERKFGVEIEFAVPTQQLLRRVSNSLRIVGDGSLRHISNSGEFVSDILQGKNGESSIARACEILKKHNATCEDPSMSVHVHHDGMVSEGILKRSETEPEDKSGKRIIAVSNKVMRTIDESSIVAVLAGVSGLFSSLSASTYDSVRYYSLGILSAKPDKNFIYFWIDKESRFKWLRNVFYFYTKYSEVMEHIVSNSRKFGNMYCIPLAKSYELSEIEGCTNMEELRTLWYRGHESGEHYDDSRYHDVNLHSFWNRHGTVEIRSHGGTVDPHKILLWVKLHQKILDKLESMELEEVKAISGKDIYRDFIDFVEEPILQSYVKRLLGFYSNINIK